MVKNLPANAGDIKDPLIPGSERSLGRGHGNPLQYSFWENPYGQRSLVGYSSWGRKESDTTERLNDKEINGANQLWIPKTLLRIQPAPNGKTVLSGS